MRGVHGFGTSPRTTRYRHDLMPRRATRVNRRHDGGTSSIDVLDAQRWNHNIHYHPLLLGAVPTGATALGTFRADRLATTAHQPPGQGRRRRRATRRGSPPSYSVALLAHLDEAGRCLDTRRSPARTGTVITLPSMGAGQVAWSVKANHMFSVRLKSSRTSPSPSGAGGGK
jgi:hypothetical protein